MDEATRRHRPRGTTATACCDRHVADAGGDTGMSATIRSLPPRTEAAWC